MKLFAMDNNLTKKLLEQIEKDGKCSSLKLAEHLKQPHQKIVGVIKSLQSIEDVIDVSQSTKKVWNLTDEGKLVCKDGSLEAQLFAKVPTDGISVADLKSVFPKCDVAMGYAFRQKWVRKDGDKLVRLTNSINDKTQEDLQGIADGGIINEAKISEYKKRQLVILVPQTEFEVKKGQNFSVNVTKQQAELTKEMIESGAWQSATFKPFNFKSKGKMEQRAGHLHPLMQLRTEFRQVFLEMGFTEMPTNNYVESAFWNFDALFQPQKHPARDAQDTFYVSNPATTLSLPQDYLEKVKEVHTVGGYGSIGYQSPWSVDEAKKNLLRTHTTAVSARLLRKLAQEGFKAAKYFSIDKVYRNETLDATHLAEFHQVEGVMCDRNLSMKNLMGTFTTFFNKIGIENIRFKPTYNPYTEPSMEMYSYHKGLEKWVEIGNSGYFRPEMLRTMGLPEDATVAGWGLSLERPAMIMYGINNIRELVGSKTKMELILDNPICTIDKYQRKCRARPSANALDQLNKRQQDLLNNLINLKSKVQQLSNKTPDADIATNISKLIKDGEVLDLVINADPTRPPHSVKALASLLLAVTDVSLHVHAHSSVQGLTDEQKHFWSCLRHTNPTSPKIVLRLVWTKMGDLCPSPSLCVSAFKHIEIFGESNISRYLCRMLETCCPSTRLYEKFEANTMSQIDNLLDYCEQIFSASNKEKSTLASTISKTLKKSLYICGSRISIADFVVLSLLRQLQVDLSSADIHKWMNYCRKTSANFVLL